MLIGYARVSTDEQNLQLQIDGLTAANCERIFTDKATGSNLDRPGLADALSHVRAGDTLVVWKLDRLGRTVKGLVELVTKLESKQVNFCSITDKIDTSSTAGRFFFHIMASLSQMERELTLERTKAGLASARALGRVGGRKRRMTDSKIDAATKLLQTGKAPKDVAKILEVSIPTLYRWIPEAASLSGS